MVVEEECRRVLNTSNMTYDCCTHLHLLKRQDIEQTTPPQKKTKSHGFFISGKLFSMYMCTFARGACGGQKRSLYPLELGFCAVRSWPIWMVGIKLGSSAKQQGLITLSHISIWKYCFYFPHLSNEGEWLLVKDLHNIFIEVRCYV